MKYIFYSLEFFCTGSNKNLNCIFLETYWGILIDFIKFCTFFNLSNIPKVCIKEIKAKINIFDIPCIIYYIHTCLPNLAILNKSSHLVQSFQNKAKFFHQLIKLMVFTLKSLIKKTSLFIFRTYETHYIFMI